MSVTTANWMARPVSGGFELSSLDPLDRVLLTSDGTLTDVLAALYLENISLVMLEQEIRPVSRRIDLLALHEGDMVLERRVLLRGSQSRRTYVHASSLVAVNRLTSRIRRALLTTTVALGQLWKASGTEVFRQVLQRDREPAGELFECLHVGPESPLLVRSYRACSNGRPVALIREHIVPPSIRGRATASGRG